MNVSVGMFTCSFVILVVMIGMMWVVYAYRREAFALLVSTELGNARASMGGTGNRYRFSRFFLWGMIAESGESISNKNIKYTYDENYIFTAVAHRCAVGYAMGVAAVAHLSTGV